MGFRTETEPVVAAKRYGHGVRSQPVRKQLAGCLKIAERLKIVGRWGIVERWKGSSRNWRYLRYYLLFRDRRRLRSHYRRCHKKWRSKLTAAGFRILTGHACATTRVSGYVSSATDHICCMCCQNGIALSLELNSIKNAGTIPDTKAVTRIAVRIPARRVALRSLAMEEAGGDCFCFDRRKKNTAWSSD